jgi:RNA polymerase sigma factor (TIGR02999 family)
VTTRPIIGEPAGPEAGAWTRGSGAGAGADWIFLLVPQASVSPVAAISRFQPGPPEPCCRPVNAGEITLVLQRIDQGDPQAAERLLPLVYEQLRHLAAARMAHEAAGHTLQPTALVHEAWLRLGADHQPEWKSRAHFFVAAAEAMRRILIDSARRRLAQRRGGRQPHVNIDDIEVAAGGNDDARVLRVNEALEKLALDEPEKAELVKLRFFAGLTLEEAAQALDITEPTARRWWTYARARLRTDMKSTQA